MPPASTATLAQCGHARRRIDRLGGAVGARSIGTVTLADGEEVLAVLGEPLLCEGQREITTYGGWRAYLAATRP